MKYLKSNFNTWSIIFMAFIVAVAVTIIVTSLVLITISIHSSFKHKDANYGFPAKANNITDFGNGCYTFELKIDGVNHKFLQNDNTYSLIEIQTK
jgi:hypothetical protein